MTAHQTTDKCLLLQALVSTTRTAAARRRRSPAPPAQPTTVPLIRMNCRSRPTCSSIRRLASSASQRSIVSVMIAVISTPYCETRCWAARTIQLSTLSRRSASSRSDSPMRTTVSAMRVRNVLDGSSTPSSTSRFSVFHAVAAALAISSRAISCSLIGSARAMVAGSCCRSSANSNRKRVAERRNSWSGLRRTLSVKSINSRWMRSPTRWSMNRGDQVGESRSTTRWMTSPAFSDHWNARSASNWIRASCRFSASSGGQYPAYRRTPLRFGDAAHDHPVDHLLDVLVAQQLHQHPQHRRRLGRHPLGVRGLRQPLTQPAGHLRVAQLGLHDRRRQEVLPHEGAQALAELVFLALDDRGVRDRVCPADA